MCGKEWPFLVWFTEVHGLFVITFALLHTVCAVTHREIQRPGAAKEGKAQQNLEK